MIGVVDEIKQKLDVAEVIGEYLSLTKAGRNLKARCPFHAEKTPSFTVSPERQIWHCFGCNEGGDIFKFVMKMEGLEFGDALRVLARKAGVVLKKQDPQVQSQKKRLYEICELSARFFGVQLQKSLLGQKAQKYLKERSMKEEIIKFWRLGFAPADWHALSDFLKKRGYKDEEIFQAGMTVETNPSTSSGYKFHDRFRSRIIFPIFDIQGQVIAFGGRIFGPAADEETAKYLNSPQTPLYDKSRVLYGLNNSKTEIRSSDLCLIVEGYMDLIMSHQAGVKNVVASSGTALTETHLIIIGRYTKNLAMAFDSDIAGDTATKRSIDLALKQDFNVRVLPMKDKDPAEVVKKNSKEWLEILNLSQSVMDFYFASTFAKFNRETLEGKREIKKILLPVIKLIASKTEQTHWLNQLAARLRVREADLMTDMQKIKISADSQLKTDRVISSNNDFPVKADFSRQEGLEERFLGLCLNHPQYFGNNLEMGIENFQDETLAQIFSQLKDSAAKGKKNLIEHLRKSLSPELKIQLDYLSLKIEQQPVETEELEIISEIETCAKELKILKIRQELTNLSFEIKEAQGSVPKEKIKELLEKFSQFSNKLANLLNNLNPNH